MTLEVWKGGVQRLLLAARKRKKMRRLVCEALFFRVVREGHRFGSCGPCSSLGLDGDGGLRLSRGGVR